MISFPNEYLEKNARVEEAPGAVMADETEAAAYNGTAGKMWRWILRPFANDVLARVPYGGRVLDLGTGPGMMPIHWARQRPDIEVVGIDLSDAMLDIARRGAERAGVAGRVSFIRADAANTGLASGSFDVVASHYMLHHFADPAAVLAEMQRLAGAEGTVIARDLVRPRPAVARAETAFTALFLRNTREQNQQYADSLAASHTADEVRDAIARAELTHLEVKSGPIHFTVEQKPRTAGATERVTHERAGRILAGACVMLSVALAQFVSPWFLLIAAGTAFNLVLSGITNRCAVKDAMIRAGLPGERDLGRAEESAAVARRTEREARAAAASSRARISGKLRRALLEIN